MPGALQPHLDLHPRILEHQSHSPGTLGERTGEEPKALSWLCLGNWENCQVMHIHPKTVLIFPVWGPTMSLSSSSPPGGLPQKDGTQCSEGHSERCCFGYDFDLNEIKPKGENRGGWLSG